LDIHLARYQNVVGALGFGDRAASKISRRPKVYASIFFVAGALVTAAAGALVYVARRWMSAEQEEQ
jgi:hypothetical protein